MYMCICVCVCVCICICIYGKISQYILFQIEIKVEPVPAGPPGQGQEKP